MPLQTEPSLDGGFPGVRWPVRPCDLGPAGLAAGGVPSTLGPVGTDESFEIVVKGRLSPSLIAAFDGFEASRCERGETHFVGSVPDQAALHRMLGMFRDLNIELVSVNSKLG